MKTMTRRECLKTIFEGGVPDRPAVKVWGADPRGTADHPGFEQVRRRAIEKTDLFIGAESPFHVYSGRNRNKLIESKEYPTETPASVHRVTTYHTPMGALREVFQKST